MKNKKRLAIALVSGVVLGVVSTLAVQKLTAKKVAPATEKNVAKQNFESKPVMPDLSSFAKRRPQ
jgi:pectin methylesterase-like acyl-CoA thioesterase